MGDTGRSAAGRTFRNGWWRRTSALGASFAAALCVACVMQHSSVAPGGDPMTITQEQIENSHAATAYDAVARLHGDFLVSRGRQSSDPNAPPTPVHVYVDDAFYGEVGTLREIPAQDVAAIRLFQSYEAQYKFGSGHLGGVIQVLTKH